MDISRTTLFVVLFAIALLAGIMAVSGCAQQLPQTGAVPKSEQGAQSAPEPALSQPPTEEEPLYTPTYVATGDEVAIITTAKGEIRIEFFPQDAPNHVAAFIELAEKGFYDGLKFHRVVPGFVIQGGDPLSRTDDPMVGTGGPGYRLAAEFNDRPHLEGTVSMARSPDPDSAGSQFFICLAPQPFLDGQYTVFGQVVEGLEVVHAITVGDVMETVRIERSE